MFVPANPFFQVQHYNLLGTFLSYKENEVLWRVLGAPGVPAKPFFQVQHYNLLGPFLSYKENEVLWMVLGAPVCPWQVFPVWCNTLTYWAHL